MMKDVVKIIQDLIGTGGDVISEGEGAAKAAGAVAAKAGALAIGGLTMAATGALAIKGAVSSKFAERKIKKSDYATKRLQAKKNLEAFKENHKNADGKFLVKDLKGKDKTEYQKLRKAAIAEEKENSKGGIFKAASNLKENVVGNISAFAGNVGGGIREKVSGLANKITKGRVDKYTHQKLTHNKATNANYWERHEISDDEKLDLSNKMMAGQQNSLRFNALAANAIQGTKVFDFVNKASFGMVTKSGRAKLDEQISKGSKDNAAVIGAAQEVRESNNSTVITKNNGEKINSYGKSAYSKMIATARQYADKAALNKSLKESADEADKQVKMDNDSIQKFAEAVKNAINNNDTNKLNALGRQMQNSEFRAKWEERGGNIDMANILSKFAEATNNGTKGNLMNAMKSNVANLNVKNLNASYSSAAKAAAGAGRAEVVRGLMSDQAYKQFKQMFVDALTKVQNSKSDVKTQNSVQELLRELINVTKINSKK